MQTKKLYTRSRAARIIDIFENLLEKNKIIIPSPEDDERDPETTGALYGSVYGELLDSVEHELASWVKDVRNVEMIQGVFSYEDFCEIGEEDISK